MIKNLYNSIFTICLLATVFAGTLGKSHSIELLHWGRHSPISLHDNSLITANTFVSTKSRVVNVYDLKDGLNPSLIQEIRSQYPMPGDDFGFSIDHYNDYMIIGAPGYNEGEGAAFLYKKVSKEWRLYKKFDNPFSQIKGKPHKFGYSVSINNKYISISSPFNNDGLVHIYRIDGSSTSKIDDVPTFNIDVRKIGDVAGCYAEGPDKFGFGISSSIDNNKLLIGSLKDFVYLINFEENEINATSITFPDFLDNISERRRFGESVHIGKESLYISSLGLNNNQGKVFKYSKLSTENSQWMLSEVISPENDLDDIYFGFRISEVNNDVFISSFNDPKIHRYSKLKNKLAFKGYFDNRTLEEGKYSSRNIVSDDSYLITDSYYAEDLYIHNFTTNNSRGLNVIPTSAKRESILQRTKCENGYAGSYECDGIDMMSYVDKTQLGGINSTILNDIWGWTDSSNGKEYALVGMSNGTSFVDISNPENPVFIGRLPTATSQSTWRDIKVYSDHAFIVSEASGHGMQVFDLTDLRNFSGTPITFSTSAYYSGFGNAHNIFINEDTAFAYAIGTSTCGPGGLHVVDISDPTLPIKSACISDPATGRSGTGYVHDVQCVIYNGPDSAYVGKEICFGSNETKVWITDVSVKSDDSTGSKTISLGSYNNYYTHQGWLTEDHKYFVVNDELDEYNSSSINKTRTLIWDVQDLDNPTLETTYSGPNASIDHNNYIIGNDVFMSHYSSGLRILDISNISNPTERAFFDVHPSNNNTNFDGSWSNYPFFESGNIVVTAIDDGLFVLKESSNLIAPLITFTVPEDGSILLEWSAATSQGDYIELYRSTVESFIPSSSNLIATMSHPSTGHLDSNLDINTVYYYKIVHVSGSDSSPVSNEVQVQPIILPNLPPTIDTVQDVEFYEDTDFTLSLTGISDGGDINSQEVSVLATASNTVLFDESVNVAMSQSGENIDYRLILSPKEDMFGESQISVLVADNGGTEDGGVDNISIDFNVNVLPVNDPPSSSSLVGEYLFNINSGEYLPGLNNRTLIINRENINDSLRFEWNNSTDIDSELLQYKIVGYDDLQFLSMEAYSVENFKTWALKDIVSQTDTINISEGYWTVEVFDGEASTLSNPFGGKLFIDGSQLIPEEWGIEQNFPNPFRNFTTFEYDVPSKEYIVIRIFNIKGQIIKTLIDEEVEAGYQLVVWDGTNEDNDPVSSGVYFCQIFTPNSSSNKFKKAKKLVKIR
tara:strand:- start:3965 stop:7657 length:3693 start_codon:yes stop_codon:yes gene_type:complete